MLESWSNPGYLKRAWCMFELYTAIRMNEIEVDIILTPSQREECKKKIQMEGFQVIDRALERVRAEDATATEQADLEAIRTLIMRYQGGYPALNRAVQVRLRTWFQTIAGIRFGKQSSTINKLRTPRGSRPKSLITSETKRLGRLPRSLAKSPPSSPPIVENCAIELPDEQNLPETSDSVQSHTSRRRSDTLRIEDLEIRGFESPNTSPAISPKTIIQQGFAIPMEKDNSKSELTEEFEYLNVDGLYNNAFNRLNSVEQLEEEVTFLELDI